MNVTELAVREAVEKHTIKLDVPVMSSTGWTSEYLDGIGMLLDRPDFWKRYFEDRIPYANSMGREKIWPVAQGASGALLLGILGRGTLLQPLDKQHGIRWNGLGRALEVAPRWSERYADRDIKPIRACLVDDCIFTGQTMINLGIEAAKVGFIVEAVVYAWPYVPDRNEAVSAKSLLGRPIVVSAEAQVEMMSDLKFGPPVSRRPIEPDFTC